MKRLTNILLIFIWLFTLNALRLEDECMNLSTFENENPEYKEQDKGLLARFLLEKKLGEGSFGYVIKGELNGKEIVIKRINASNPMTKDLLTTEIEVLKNLKNEPSLLNYHLCVLEGRNVYLFTELLYKDLDDNKEFKLKSQGEKIEFYIQLAKAIKQLHSLGYVHNDIKPANFMVTDKTFSTPKLIDFGLTTEIGLRTIGGSPIFVPLEKLNEEPLSKPEMDVVSYGVSIVALESSVDNLISIVQKQWGFSLGSVWSSYHHEAAKSVSGIYPLPIEDPNFIVRLWRWFKGFFVNNNKDRVYSFEDLLNGLMENKTSYRLNLDEAIELLERFKEVYKVDNEDLRKANHESDQIIVDNGDQNLEILGKTKKLVQTETFEKVINTQISKVHDKSKIIIIL